MPEEKRDRKTGALLFVPTQSEKATKESSLKLQQGLQEVDKMKSELQDLIDKAKKNN